MEVKAPPDLRLDPDDVAQEIALARHRAKRLGFDPDAAEAEAVEQLLQDRERRHRSGVPHWIPATRKLVGLRPAKTLTLGQRRKYIRNLMVYTASVAGFPERYIAEGYGLPPSRVHAIIKQMREMVGGN